MTPDPSRLDPLAPIALAVVTLPFLAALVLDSVTMPWRLCAALIGGGLGLVSLRRIHRSAGRLRGRPVALVAAVGGLGLGMLGLLALLVVLAIFVAAGSP